MKTFNGLCYDGSILNVSRQASAVVAFTMVEHSNGHNSITVLSRLVDLELVVNSFLATSHIQISAVYLSASAPSSYSFTIHHTKLIHVIGSSVSFKSCDFAGARIENCDLPKCHIEKSYFSKTSMRVVNMIKCVIGNSTLGVLVNVDFSESIMPNTQCIEAVRRCRMDEIIGSGMLFRGCVYETTFTWANLRGSIFFGPVEKCVFYCADLSDAIFENDSYDLESEMFRYANFNQTFINGGYVTRLVTLY